MSALPRVTPASTWNPIRAVSTKWGNIYRKGPADHDYVKIAPGNFIPFGERKGTEDQRKLLEALQHSAGRKFEFLVNSGPPRTALTIDLEPLNGAARATCNDRWVDRKRMVPN
jgi:hypothetical protein